MNRQQRRRLARAGATVPDPTSVRGPDPDALVAAAVEHHQHGRLAEEGASPGAELLAHYGEVDVALDPFPVNGGTTTLEALALGVPVVSLAGHHPAGRLGASLLGSLGLSELVTDSIDGYIATATRLARDLDRLATLRAELRDRLATSPVGDGPTFTHGLEFAYRQMWREWCRRPAPEPW